MGLAWDDFRLVKAVADRGGLTRAAAHLGINHSTAFRRLAGIEAALDARLFERHRSGYVATPEGDAMIAAAGRMEEDVAGFDRAVAGHALTPSGELRVTAAAAFATDLLMPMLARFRARYPAVHVELVISEEALNLSRRDADVALRASDAAPPTLVGRRLSGLAWGVYGRADDAGDPAQRTWVTPGDGVGGGRFTRFVAARADPARIALRINTVLGLAEAVEAGLGIGPLPCLAGDARPGLRRISGPHSELGSSLWLLTHPDLRHAARVRAFMQVCAEAVAPLRPRLEGRTGETGTATT